MTAAAPNRKSKHTAGMSRSVHTIQNLQLLQTKELGTILATWQNYVAACVCVCPVLRTQLVSSATNQPTNLQPHLLNIAILAVHRDRGSFLPRQCDMAIFPFAHAWLR